MDKIKLVALCQNAQALDGITGGLPTTTLPIPGLGSLRFTEEGFFFFV